MARIRKNRENHAPAEPLWKIGLYIRLSKEDGNAHESESIVNQEKILRDFVDGYFEAGTFIIVDVFADDGLTGTDKQRPEFQRLEKCIASKAINCMILKSLARGFRNLADQQKFLEEFIPAHGARFINLSAPFIDNYKNPRSASGLEVPIRGMFNEQFAAQTSEEIRKTFKMKRERGEFIGAFAPYGLKKSPSDKNKLLIDENAAQVVRNIFDWFVNKGYSKRGIAQRLNQMGVPNPAEYKRKGGLKYQNPNTSVNDGMWTSATVARILQNQMYIGLMVQGKYRVISYKVHTQVNVPEGEWFVVPNTHEAIINKETFDKAQALHARDTRTANAQKEVHMFSGFVRCADCQKAMHRKTVRQYVYYFCRSYEDKKICTKHAIRLDKLEHIVLTVIRKHIRLIDNLSQVMAHIHNAPSAHNESTQLTNALKTAKKQLNQHNDVADSLYMDWKSGDITKEEYRRLKSKVAEQLQQLEQNIAYLTEAIQGLADDTGSAHPYLADFLKYRNIQTLSRGIIVALIDRIWVHEDGAVTIDLNYSEMLCTY
ncbi:MAG: recombinase family protein [Defluviitaleaceae bacterium]|nr:recombinase family protein [Defluviitaleaceae bacterium]